MGVPANLRPDIRMLPRITSPLFVTLELLMVDCVSPGTLKAATPAIRQTQIRNEHLRLGVYSRSMPTASAGTLAAYRSRCSENYYFLRRATSRTRRVCEIAPGVSASFRISANSCWCRLADPVAGLALSGLPT